MKKVEEEEAHKESTNEPSWYKNVVHAQHSKSSIGYIYKSSKSRKIGIETRFISIFNYF